MTSTGKRVSDVIEKLRVPITVIVDEGADPGEILALGVLVSRHAPPGTDLERLRDALANSTLADVVAEVAFALQPDDVDEEEPGLAVDVDELGEEPDLLGED
jgi:hypothetical protein